MSDTVEVQAEAPFAQTRVKKRMPLGNVLSFVVGLVGIAALGAAGWVYTETQREVVRLSTDIAQIRVSLELFNRQQGTVPAAAANDSSELTDLADRLSILEENWRNPPAPALPDIPTAPVTSNNAAVSGDCLPTGTRFLVTTGDMYPVCGTSDAKVEIAGVDNGFVTLLDGTVIASGGNIALPGSQCMIGVVSSGQDGMTGYAEIRVTC